MEAILLLMLAWKWPVYVLPFIAFLALWSWLYVCLERNGNIFAGEWATWHYERFWGR